MHVVYRVELLVNGFRFNSDHMNEADARRCMREFIEENPDCSAALRALSVNEYMDEVSSK